jgi:hypothetical protein
LVSRWYLDSTDSTLDELDTQTLLSPEKSFYVQWFANEDFWHFLVKKTDPETVRFWSAVNAAKLGSAAGRRIGLKSMDFKIGGGVSFFFKLFHCLYLRKYHTYWTAEFKMVAKTFLSCYNKIKSSQAKKSNWLCEK